VGFPPEVCATAFLACAVRSLTALSTAASDLLPFAAPTALHGRCTSLSAWQHMHSRFPDHFPPSADGLSTLVASKLAQLRTLVCRAFHAASHAELLSLWPTDRAHALIHSIVTRPQQHVARRSPVGPVPPPGRPSLPGCTPRQYWSPHFLLLQQCMDVRLRSFSGKLGCHVCPRLQSA
jgi:hypothetical protein